MGRAAGGRAAPAAGRRPPAPTAAPPPPRPSRPTGRRSAARGSLRADAGANPPRPLESEGMENDQVENLEVGGFGMLNGLRRLFPTSVMLWVASLWNLEVSKV